jgi:hypothetical protein
MIKKQNDACLGHLHYAEDPGLLKASI